MAGARGSSQLRKPEQAEVTAVARNPKVKDDRYDDEIEKSLRTMAGHARNYSKTGPKRNEDACHHVINSDLDELERRGFGKGKKKGQ